MTNPVLFGLKSSTEVFVKIAFFPLWWFTGGLFWYAGKCWKFFMGWVELSGVLVWLKNIFKPMYGQRDWAGLAIGFVIRLVQVIFRGAFAALWAVVTIFFFLLWLAIPLYAAYQVMFQLFPETRLYFDTIFGLFMI